MARGIIIAVLLLAIGATTDSATAEVIGLYRKLYTACAPMDFVVENLEPEESQEIGLTDQAIENVVESRLRAARLFAPSEKQDRKQYLHINVTIVGRAFNINVELRRFLDDLGYGVGGVVEVWNAGGTGTHGGNGQYILGIVSRYLDEFIASYLRVNEAHCSR